MNWFVKRPNFAKTACVPQAMKANVVLRLFGSRYRGAQRIIGGTPMGATGTVALPSRLLEVAVAAALLAGCGSSVRAELLAQWNFNSDPPDTLGNTGTNRPSFGVGTVALIGGATATFASGNGSSDPATVDDTGWNTATYPAQGVGNKTRGVQFNVSTEGFQQIRITWDHRNSSTSSRYIRFQYSTNGTDFIDGPVLTTTVQDTYFGKVVDLSSVSVVNNLVNNKSNFAFRIVSEFESTATGGGAAQYVATTTGQTYSTGGTWRFDMVTVSGEIFSGNEFPSISMISNQTIRMNTLSDEIPFTVGDFETPANDLVVTATSSNPTLLADVDIFLSGGESNRTVRFFPAADQNGTAIITLTVTDAFNNITTTSFLVTVLPGNTPPTISSFTNYHTVVNVPLAPIPFTVGDVETAAGDLTVTAISSNPTLIPNAGVVLGGTGGNRTLTITPAAEETGNAVITLMVSDGELMASREFAVMVVPSSSVLLFDPFTYPDGPLNAVSAFRWAHHSGIGGEIEVFNGTARLSSDDTEDISAILIGAPYTPASGKVLYAAFTVNFSAVPSPLGEYFAHFRGLNNTGPFFARVFAMNTNAGTFLLGIGNTATVSNAVMFPQEFGLGSNNVVVVRYDVGAAVSTLWVNPRSEADTSITATDSATSGPAPVLAWSFRQSSTGNGSIGTSIIDDVKVGLSFADVAPGYRLRIKVEPAIVELSWPSIATDEGYLLEGTTDLTAGNWQLVPDAPTRADGRDRVTLSRLPPQTTTAAFYRLAK
jgi:hypothetical protein